MDESLFDQFNKQVDKANNIGIVLTENTTVDAIAGALTLRAYLLTKNKTTSIFCSQKQLPELKFFDSLPRFYNSINSSSELGIHVSNANSKPNELRYEKVEDGIDIFINPTQGEKGFTEKDVSITPSGQNLDLLVVLGASNFEQLGGLYLKNPQLFFNTTKIAIGIKADHEYFAAVNIVDTQAAALCEIIFDIVGQKKELFNQDIVSTSLLAGIISQTQSFREPKTTPVTLSKAAKLVVSGARQQDIIKYLFKTKSFKLLQLWGRAMARIKSIPENNLMLTLLTKQDLIKTKSSVDMLVDVARELVEMSASTQLVVIAMELEQGSRVLLAGLPHIRLRKVATKLTDETLDPPEPLIGNYSYIQFDLINIELAQAEKFIVDQLPKQ